MLQINKRHFTGQVGGHEGIGEVISNGPGVNSPSIGTNVGIKGAALGCFYGGEICCTKSEVSGFSTAGTFQQYYITSALYATPIPAGIDLAGAAPLLCGGTSVYTALKRAQTRRGKYTVLQCGASSISILFRTSAQYSTRLLALNFLPQVIITKKTAQMAMAMNAAEIKQFCVPMPSNQGVILFTRQLGLIITKSG